MIRSGKRVFLVMIGVSLAVSGVGAEAEGGWLIRNPYVEGHRVVNRPRLIGSTGTAGHVHCHCCTGTSCGKAYKKAELTTAILCLRVSEDADVVVNGQRTEKRRLAGDNRNTRTFSFAGLKPGETRDCVVKAALGGATPVVYRYTLRAGEVTEEQIAAAEISVPQDDSTPAEDAARRAEEAARRAEEAAQRASEAEENVGLLKDQATKAARSAADSAVNAAQAAVNAARMNGERYIIGEKDHDLVIVAYINSYADDGSVNNLKFDGPTTPGGLVFKETTGALERIQDAQIEIRYDFTIELAGQTDVKFGLMPRNVPFKRGHAEVPFLDREDQTKPLAGEFTTEIQKHLSRLHGTASITVRISVIRPNGEPMEFANAIVITLRDVTK